MKAFITRCFSDETETGGTIQVVQADGETAILSDERGNVAVDFGAGFEGSLIAGEAAARLVTEAIQSAQDEIATLTAERDEAQAARDALRAEFDAYKAAHPAT